MVDILVSNLPSLEKPQSKREEPKITQSKREEPKIMSNLFHIYI